MKQQNKTEIKTEKSEYQELNGKTHKSARKNLFAFVIIVGGGVYHNKYHKYTPLTSFEKKSIVIQVIMIFTTTEIKTNGVKSTIP